MHIYQRPVFNKILLLCFSTRPCVLRLGLWCDSCIWVTLWTSFASASLPVMVPSQWRCPLCWIYQFAWHSHSHVSTLFLPWQAGNMDGIKGLLALWLPAWFGAMAGEPRREEEKGQGILSVLLLPSRVITGRFLIPLTKGNSSGALTVSNFGSPFTVSSCRLSSPSYYTTRRGFPLP